MLALRSASAPQKHASANRTMQLTPLALARDTVDGTLAVGVHVREIPNPDPTRRKPLRHVGAALSHELGPIKAAPGLLHGPVRRQSSLLPRRS